MPRISTTVGQSGSRSRESEGMALRQCGFWLSRCTCRRRCLGRICMTRENVPGITDLAELAREEERLSKCRAAELYDSGRLDVLETGSYAGLSAIHQFLFQDVYAFAGQLRTVNIAKGGFRFAPAMYLEASLGHIDAMPDSSFEEIVEKYVEMNIAHPFREGNGRSARIWLDCMLKKALGVVIDWSRVDKEDYLLAMERSPIRDIEIKHVIREALTDRVDDRAVFMKGVDASYYYEGYNVYRTEDLA